MKRNLMVLSAVVGGLFFAAPEVRADPPAWGFQIGFGMGGGYVQARIGNPHRHGHLRPPVIVAPAPVVHVHHRVPIYRQVWVPACYQQVLVGYNCFGMPVYSTVCVSPGHYETVLAGYRCECGYCF